jgi:hypothetical protein
MSACEFIGAIGWGLFFGLAFVFKKERKRHQSAASSMLDFYSRKFQSQEDIHKEQIEKLNDRIEKYYRIF